MPPFFWKPNAFDDDYDHDFTNEESPRNRELSGKVPPRDPKTQLERISLLAEETLLRTLMREREDLATRLMETDWSIWVLEERFRTGGNQE